MKKGALITFTKFTGKHLRHILFFNKVTGLKAATLLKKKLWFFTSRLFSHEATFFVTKIFDNGKYKKHATNKIRSSRPEVFCK